MTRIRWPFWMLLLFWTGVLWFGYQTYRALQTAMEPTISAVRAVAEKVKQ